MEVNLYQYKIELIGRLCCFLRVNQIAIAVIRIAFRKGTTADSYSLIPPRGVREGLLYANDSSRQQKSLPVMPRTSERDDVLALLFGFFDGVTTKTLAQSGEHFGRI